MKKPESSKYRTYKVHSQGESPGLHQIFNMLSLDLPKTLSLTGHDQWIFIYRIPLNAEWAHHLYTETTYIFSAQTGEHAWN